MLRMSRILITGGTQGIGAAIVAELGEAGINSGADGIHVEQFADEAGGAHRDLTRRDTDLGTR